MVEYTINPAKLKNIMEIYSISTTIGCKAVKKQNGDMLYPSSHQLPSFCNFICSFDKSKQDCRNSYIYGGLQAEKLGEQYIYFCPYGLVNWAVPLLGEVDMEFIMVGGPVLLHQPDDLLIEDILKQNPLLGSNYRELRDHLNKLHVLDTLKVRYLSQLLMELAKNLMITNAIKLEKKQELNNINARVAEKIHELKNNTENPTSIYPLEKEKQLIKKVKLGDRPGARALLNDLLGFIYFQSSNKFSIVKNRAIELMVVLARAALEVGADLELIFGLEYTYYEYINQVKSLDQLSEILTKILDRFIECTFSIKNVKNKDIIYKAMSYIRDNFYDKNISLGDVANEIGLSSAYFSKLFKDELEMTYTDYLNKVRVEAGKELLKKNHPLAEVAQTIGYNDQSYFSKVFKKVEGITPGKWQNKKVQ